MFEDSRRWRAGCWEVRKSQSQEISEARREEGTEAGREVGVGETGGGGW